jgi:hypothetical protein
MLWAALCATRVAWSQPGQDSQGGDPARASFTRDDQGRATVRAIRLAEPLRVDGELNEAVYRSTAPVTGFFQTLPGENAPASERTEAWVMYDATQIYVAARLWDSAPPDQWTANEMRRDTSQLRQNDHFGVAFDTFHDRRNGFFFYANPLGARADSYMTDESNNNADWNPVWEARTGRFDGGWTVEMAIPFKSLRYVSGPGQVWGIQMRRAVRRKNEWDHLNPLPIAIGGASGMMRVSADASLIGLDLPPASRNIEVKPYAVARTTTDRLALPALSNSFDPDVGFDAKYGINANLTADVTVNTDFAQVEVDEQQVNLTRFSLLYPEKRDFFLEGRGIFDFGRAGGGTGGGTTNTPQLFYSRRIGLTANRIVPILVGGRLTGKLGPFSVGVIDMATGEEDASKTPRTHFSVVRLKRDILRRSSVGIMATNRSQSTVSPGASNLAYGADAAFAFFQNVSLGAYYARSNTEGVKADNVSYQGRFDFSPDRYGVQLQYLKVGSHFLPEVGFVRRVDFSRSFGSLRFSPRPKNHFKDIRQFSYEASLEYLENGAGLLETRNQIGHFEAERQNSDVFTVDADFHYELLVRPFTVAPAVVIPGGSYPFNDVTIAYQLGQQRRLSGRASLQTGEFYDGTIRAYGFSTGRLEILKQWSFEPSLAINDVDLPAGAFTQAVLRGRTDYGFSPRRFVSALVQYSSTDHVISSNLRFRWEYRPGSELFLVYTDERDTQAPGVPGLRNRAFVVKVNRLWQF